MSGASSNTDPARWLAPAVAAIGVAAVISAIWINRTDQARPAADAPPTREGVLIRIEATPVPLDPRDAATTAAGAFRFAGGLALTSADTDRLHGLSGLVVTAPETLIAVSDGGLLFRARLVLDAAGGLVGMRDASFTPLTGEDGAPLGEKEEADAEDIALLPNGDRLVSFERQHRILRYPASGGAPQPAPFPDAPFPPNGGMEALGIDPTAGADAYVVGAEATGETWTCRVSQPACVPGPPIDRPAGFGLTAMHRVSETRTAYLLRAYDPAAGVRVRLTIREGSAEVARLELAPPMTVDNFEGLSGVPLPGGGVRFYLLSDDNASDTQRTLLLAFDWLG